MDFEQALEIANAVLSARLGRQLSDVETTILRGSWHNQTYEQIADESGYSISYLTRDVGPKFWKHLSQALGETVSKTNFRIALERQTSQPIQKAAEPHNKRAKPLTEKQSPSSHPPLPPLPLTATGVKPLMSPSFADAPKNSTP